MQYLNFLVMSALAQDLVGLWYDADATEVPGCGLLQGEQLGRRRGLWAAGAGAGDGLQDEWQ